MSVEIYIDNEKFSTEDKRFKTLGSAIKEVNDHIFKEKKIAVKIYVNGKEFSENTVMNSERNIIEFKTKTESSVMLDGVYMMEKYKNRYFELLEESDFQEIDMEDTGYLLQELIGIAGWMLKHLSAIGNNSAIDMIDLDFKDDFEEFEEIYSELKEAYEQGDSERIWDILEYEISDMILIFCEKIELYSKYFLEEQRRVKFLS